MRPGFDAELLRAVVAALRGGLDVIAHGLPIYVALEPVDMRLGSERLGALCESGCALSRARERCSRS